jgi:DNA-binding response OmpR family regulator
MQRLPVLMLTARGQLKDREMAEKAGVTRFMTKPFSNSEVLTAVRDLYAQAYQEPQDAAP